MQNIVSYGCSITFGTELSDTGLDSNRPHRPSQLTWPALLAKRANRNYWCHARGGSGNLCILDRLLQNVRPHSDHVFIVNWTFVDRFDYSDPHGYHFNNGEADYETLTPTSQDLAAKIYYSDLHSEYRDKFTSLIYVKTAVETLLANGARFLMTSIDPTLLDRKWHAPAHVIRLQDSVRDYFYDFDGSDFLSWSRDQAHDIGTAGHPLEAAHAAAADLMWPNLQKLLDHNRV